MNFSAFALSLLVLACRAGAGEVLELTDSTFADQVAAVFDDQVLLVDFYAPWCQQCKKLDPILQTLARNIAPTEMVVAKVDVIKNKALGDQFGITRYPTVKFLYRHKWAAYEGTRDLDSFYVFAEKMRNPGFVTVSSAEEAKALSISRDDDIVFAFCPSPKDKRSLKQHSTAMETFVSTTESLKHKVKFVMLANMDDLGDLFVHPQKSKPMATPFFAKMEGGEPPLYYDGALGNDTLLIKWVEDNNVPLLSKVETHNFATLAKGNLLVVALLQPSLFTSAEELHQALDALKQAAREIPQPVRDGCSFGWMDTTNWASFVENFGVYSTDPLPQFVVIDDDRNVFYTRPHLHEVSGVGQFVLDVIKGKVPAQTDRFMIDLPKRLYHRFVYFWPYSCLAFIPLLLVLWACLAPDMPEDGFVEAAGEEESTGKKGESTGTKGNGSRRAAGSGKSAAAAGGGGGGGAERKKQK